MNQAALGVPAALTVQARGLTKSFGSREVVSDVNISLPRGHAFGLLGPNGSGKTTTIRLLTGLLTPDAGEVKLFGETVTSRSSDGLRQRIGVQSDSSMYETLTARENLKIWGELFGIERHKLNARIDELFEILGLTARANSRVGEFSKGMKQKLALGRAIIHKPELLFLDEPTASLDPESSADVLTHISQMITTLDTTVFICTHQLHGLEKLCDSIGILKNGQLLAVGPVPTLLQERWPRQRLSLSLAGDMTLAVKTSENLGGIEVVASADGQLGVLADGDRSVSELVSSLVHAGISVYAVVPDKPTIEELYFDTLGEGVSA